MVAALCARLITRSGVRYKRVLRARILCVSLSYRHWPPRTLLNPQVPLIAGLIRALSTGRQLPQQARLIKQAISPLMSEQQYQVLQPVIVTSTSLKTYTGDVILNGCLKVASVTEKDSDGVVLGLKSDDGPVSLHDFCLGEVKHLFSSIVWALTGSSCSVVWSAAVLQQLCELSTQ